MKTGIAGFKQAAVFGNRMILYLSRIREPEQQFEILVVFLPYAGQVDDKLHGY